MFGLPSWRIGTAFGIPLEVNPTWVIVFALIATTLAFSYFPSVEAASGLPTAVYVVMGLATALLFFASVVFHELSHSLVARAGGLRIARVTLFIFGGVAQMEDEPRRPGHELVLALAGPFASLVLSGLFTVFYVVAAAVRAPAAVSAPLEYLAVINMSVAVFNLLPGFPLDGGRVLRAILWALTGDQLRATRWASRVGQTIGFLLMAGGIAGAFFISLDMVWLVLIGWFIAGLAEGAYRQQAVRSALAGRVVRDVMTPRPMVAPAEISLEVLAHDYFLGGRHSRYPVVEQGRITGLVTLAIAKRVARADWPAVRVAEVAFRDMDALVVAPSTPLEAAAARLGPEDPGALLVVEGGMVVGIVTREDVHRALRVEQ